MTTLVSGDMGSGCTGVDSTACVSSASSLWSVWISVCAAWVNCTQRWCSCWSFCCIWLTYTGHWSLVSWMALANLAIRASTLPILLARWWSVAFSDFGCWDTTSTCWLADPDDDACDDKANPTDGMAKPGIFKPWSGLTAPALSFFGLVFWLPCFTLLSHREPQLPQKLRFSGVMWPQPQTHFCGMGDFGLGPNWKTFLNWWKGSEWWLAMQPKRCNQSDGETLPEFFLSQKRVFALLERTLRCQAGERTWRPPGMAGKKRALSLGLAEKTFEPSNGKKQKKNEYP